MTDASIESADLPEPDVYKLTQFKPSGVRPYRRMIPESERLLAAHDNNEIKHADVSLVEVHNVNMWIDSRTICLYDSYDGVYDSLSLEPDSMNWDAAVSSSVIDVPGTSFFFPHLDPQNYYHWLIDTIPCFGVLEMAGVDIHSAEKIYIHRMSNDFQWKILQQMGVDAQKILRFQGKVNHYFYEKLLIPCFRLRGSGWPHPWSADYLRKRFTLPEQSVPCNPLAANTKKLYIARGKARRTVINEGALIEKLEMLGYTILYPHEQTFDEQVHALKDVDFVLASHGAGLANIVFSRPGTKVMEFGGHYVTSHFRMLSEFSGAWYRAIAAGVDANGQRLPISNGSKERSMDFTADIQEIVAKAEAFCLESTPPSANTIVA